MKPIVIIDIDGTIGDYYSSFFAFARDWLGLYKDDWAETYDGSVPMAKHMKIGDALYRQIKLAYQQGGIRRSMKPFVAAGTFTEWMGTLDVEVWVTNPRMDSRHFTDPGIRHWLKRNNIRFDHLIYEDDRCNSSLIQLYKIELSAFLMIILFLMIAP